MKRLTKSLLLSASASVLCLTLPTYATSDPLNIMTSFSILKDMVEQVAGDEAKVEALVGPDGDTHVFSPGPADARKLAKADLLFVNGLEFEGWMDRLIEASGFDGTLIVATDGIATLAFEEGGEHHDDHGDDEHHDDHGDDEHHEDEHHEDEHHEDEHHEDEHHEDEHHEDEHHEDEHHEDEHHEDEHHEDEHHEDEYHEDEHHEDEHHEDEHHEDEHHEDEHHEDEHHDDEHHEDKHHDDEHHDDEHAGHDHHDHGEFDPHGWQSLRQAAVYIDNIADALIAAHPEASADFESRRTAYKGQLAALDSRLAADFASIDEHCRTIITSHDAFQYFGADYGLNFIAPQGLSTASEASARDVVGLIEQARTVGVGGIFVENITDSRLIEQIAKETGLQLGGTLYSGALSQADGEAPTYLAMITHNAEQLLGSMRLASESGQCKGKDH